MRRIKDPDAFKRSNLANWSQNTEFWLQGRLRHLREIRKETRAIIAAEVSRMGDRNITVVDMGCGEGWLLRLLLPYGERIRYIGLDFNPGFIDRLAKQYRSNSHVSFRCLDVEGEVPGDLQGAADIVINCFNFFELPRLSKAFGNAVEMLKRNGVLLVVTIDPLTQLMAISDTLDVLLKNIAAFGRDGSRIAYDKRIDVDGPASTRVYKGILYSLEDYLAAAAEADTSIIGYKELRRTQRRPPQIYQFLLFGRAKRGVAGVRVLGGEARANDVSTKRTGAGGSR